MKLLRAAIVVMLLLIEVSARSVSPLAGEWQMSGGGARLKFVEAPGSDGVLNILWVDGPDLSIPAGTKIGEAVATAARGEFDCHVSTDPRNKSDKRRLARFVIRMDADTGDTFKIHPYEQSVKFSIQALLPYWWRRPFRTVDTRPKGLDGARRVGAPPPYVEL